MVTRLCPDCQTEKPLTEFVRNRSTPSGYGGYCRPCHNVRGSASVKKNHGTTRHYHLTQRYGIGEAEVQEMVEEQGGMCLICQRPLDSVHVDHDHNTGAIRGILCFTCNVGLGNFKDDPWRLERAAEYLRAS